MVKKMIIFFLLILTLYPTTKSVIINADSINERDLLIVAYNPNLPPYQFEEGGIPKGFSIDVISHIGYLEGFDIEFVAMNKEATIEALQKGIIDVALNIHFLQKLGELMEFSDPIYTSSVGVLVHIDNTNDIESITDLSENIVSIERGTVEYEFMKNIRRIKYNVTTKQKNSLQLLKNQRSIALVGDHITAKYYLDYYDLKDQYKFVSSNVLPIEYTMAVQKENYRLLGQLNRGLRTIKSEGIYSELNEKWFLDQDEILMERLLLIIKIIAGLLIFAILIFLISLRWNRQLQKLVNKKTKDLSKLNKSLEEQVQKTESSYLFQKQILDSSPRGIITCDKNGIITSFNPKAKIISGKNKDVINCHYEDIPLLKFLLSDKVEKIVDKKFFIEETYWTRDDQVEFYLRYYIYPLFGFEREVKGIILTFEDHTAERKLREQIYNQEKTKTLSRVVAGIAHEIRNPLTSIKTFVELIPKKMNNTRFQKEIATYVPKEINRLNLLIEGLIDYARPQSTNKELIDASKIVHECVILFERTVANNGLSLVTKIENNLWIEVDRNQLKQVLINFIINSIDAMLMKNEFNLTLSIKAYERDGQILIEVNDEGIGMDTQEIERVFEPFYTTKSKGTGLGLAISEQYVRENKGTLHIKSVKGKGTAILVTFEKKGEGNG